MNEFNEKYCCCCFCVFSPLMSGCESGEIARFEHQPSNLFYETRDFYSSELNEYKIQGVLFSIAVKQITYGDFSVWVSLYSSLSSVPAITIKSVKLLGDEWQESYSVDKEMRFTEEVGDGGLFEDSVKISVSGEAFPLLNRSQSIMVEVEYSIGEEDRTMDFYIERRVEKYTNFPT